MPIEILKSHGIDISREILHCRNKYTKKYNITCGYNDIDLAVKGIKPEVFLNLVTTYCLCK
jgi:hypothetical protein